MKTLTIKDIASIAATCSSDRELNTKLLLLLSLEELDQDTFLEYLEMTQADAIDTLTLWNAIVTEYQLATGKNPTGRSYEEMADAIEATTPEPTDDQIDAAILDQGDAQ